MRNSFRWVMAAAVTAMLPLLAVRGDEPPVLVLDNARIIDGEHPAYPADAVVARDPDEARRFGERNVGQY
jgi:hypothetical protein